MAQPVLGTPWKKLDRAVPEEEVAWLDRYWRCANYLSVGQIYLRSNPLMRKTSRTRRALTDSRAKM